MAGKIFCKLKAAALKKERHSQWSNALS